MGTQGMAPHHPQQIPPRLTWRERELLSLLQAGGRQWTPDTKLARITLKFEALIHRLRARGVPIQALAQISGAKLYRIAPKLLALEPPPAVNPTVRERGSSSFILTPMSRRKSGRTA